MKIKVIRDTFTKKSTLGKLYINDQYICETLEDTVRGYGVKVLGQTAIPYGKYNVKVTMSSRFKRFMPILYSETDEVTLKGNGISFLGIRIHGGNTSENTEGCILVAFERVNDDFIQGTAESKLTKILKKYKEINITIKR